MADITFALPQTEDVIELAKQKFQLDIERARIDIKVRNDERLKVQGELEAQRAITRQLKADAATAELRAAETQLNHDIEMARNFHHCVYRFSDEVESHSVTECISTLTVWDRLHPTQDFEVVFHSPGGSVTDGFDLYDFLQEQKRNGHNLTAAARGMAASMGGILLQAGLATPEAPKSKRVMGREAVVLIHEVSSGVKGKIGDIKDEMELIEKLHQRALGIFAAGSKYAYEHGTSEVMLTAEQFDHGDLELGIPGWNRKDWWLTSDECLRYGIVDELR